MEIEHDNFSTGRLHRNRTFLHGEDTPELLGRSALRRMGHAVAKTGRAAVKVTKATVMIPTQLMLNPTPSGLKRAMRRTGSTISTAVRAPTHLFLETTRVSISATKKIADKIKREVEKMVRKLARQKLFSKPKKKQKLAGIDPNEETDQPIAKMSRSAAINYLTPIATTAGTGLGAEIGSIFPGYGTAAGAAIGGATAGIVTPAVVNKLYSIFDKNKNKNLAKGMSEEAAAELAAAETEKSLDGKMPFLTLALAGSALAFFMLRRRTSRTQTK